MPQRKKSNMIKWLLISLLIAVSAYLIIQGIRCSFAVQAGRERLSAYEATTAQLSYGQMSYVDKGSGEVILSIHGMFGGYDQAYDNVKDFLSQCRIIAPSRFGYPGSDVCGAATPSEQAKAYVELLDQLKIDKVYLLATSAGATAAIRFALDYPERTKGLILYSSAMPLTEKPDTISEYQGPPGFLCRDYPMFLLSPCFETIMGMDPTIIASMLPCAERKAGVVLDAAVNNPDMARNFDSYPIESLRVPTLIVHAKDDKLAKFEHVEKVSRRFPQCSIVLFADGGHMMKGHGEEIHRAVTEFMARYQ